MRIVVVVTSGDDIVDGDGLADCDVSGTITPIESVGIVTDKLLNV